MMKTLRIFLLSVLLLGAGTAASAQNARCLPARADGVDPYQDGEKIVFNVSYNWHAVQTDVAKANLTADQTTLNGPSAYMDLDVSPEDYEAMVRKPAGR